MTSDIVIHEKPRIYFLELRNMEQLVLLRRDVCGDSLFYSLYFLMLFRVRHVISVERSDTVVCAFSGCEPSWSLVSLVDPLGLEKMETYTLSKHDSAKPGSLGVWKGTGVKGEVLEYVCVGRGEDLLPSEGGVLLL